MTGYVNSLRWAQGQAGQAIALWQQGEAATRQARADHAAAVAQQNADINTAAASGVQLVASPIPFTDPGEALRAQAQHVLGEARRQLASAGDMAATSVSQAQQQAPQERNLLEKAGDALGDAWEATRDGLGEAVRVGGDYVGGAAEYLVHAAGEEVAGVIDFFGGRAATVAETYAAGLSAGGNLPGPVGDWLEEQGQTATRDAEAFRTGVNDASRGTQEAFDGWGATANEHIDRGADAAGDWVAGEDDDLPHYVLIDPQRYPETALHVLQAQEGTSWDGDTVRPGHHPQPADLTIDRDGADERRKEALAHVPTRPGVDRDEYPPALFEEGGEGASVKYVNPSDNRGAGSSMEGQIRGQGLQDGDEVRIVVG